VNEDRSRDECFLKRVENIMIKRVKLPKDVFLGKIDQYKYNNDVQVVKDKLVVKVCKT